MKFTAAITILAVAISGVAAGKGKGGGKGDGYSYNYEYDDRKLKAVSTSTVMEEHSACMDVDYNMHLVIEGFHFVGLASPVDSAECPNMVFQSLTTDEAGTVGKFAMIAPVEVVESSNADNKLYLGNKSLKTIISAYDAAPVGKEGAKFYDSITNNCVSLLRNMADPLDIEINDEMIGFVSKKLLSHSDTSLWEGIKDSPSLSLLVAGGNRMLKGMNKEEMLSKLIKLYV